MQVAGAIRAALLAVVMLCQTQGACGAPTVRLCGRQLSKYMSLICDSYNSPNNAAEHPSGPIRHKRELGIADECCKHGCRMSELNQYCQIRNYSTEFQEPHQIADRSAEGSNVQSKVEEPPPVISGSRKKSGRGEVGRTRARGYGRGRRLHGRCRCRRKKRSGRRRSILMDPRKGCVARCARGGHRFSSSGVGSYNARKPASTVP